MRDIHVCFAADDGYAPYCAVAIQSILINADPNDRLFIYVLHGGLSKQNIEILEKNSAIVKIDKTYFQEMPIVSGEHFSHIETYFRFAIARLFPDIKKMLYLDCDILVRGSLWPLYSMDIKGKTIGLVKDIAYDLGQLKRPDYNAGVMLMDCEKWRKDNIEQLLLQYAVQNKALIRMVDQDVINGALSSDIYEISCEYNKQIRMAALTDEAIERIAHDDRIVILHYLTAVKPWHCVHQNMLVDEYFSCLERTPIQFVDKRNDYKNIDRKKYYDYLLQARYLAHEGYANPNTNLVLVFEKEINNEFELAAKDTGFLYVRSALLGGIPKRRTNTQCSLALGAPNSADSSLDSSQSLDFMIIDSYDYNRIAKEMGEKGYFYQKDYILLRTSEHDLVEKQLAEHQMTDHTKVGLYGTANWAGKCTEVLGRMGVQIVFYLDSDKAREGSRLFGKQIIHPDKLPRQGLDYDIIVIASSAYEAIKEILLGQGVAKERIISFDAFM